MSGLRHREAIGEIGEAELLTEGPFSHLAVPVMSETGVAKLLVLTESDAASLKASLDAALSARPEADRAARFRASILASRSS